MRPLLAAGVSVVSLYTTQLTVLLSFRLLLELLMTFARCNVGGGDEDDSDDDDEVEDEVEDEDAILTLTCVCWLDNSISPNFHWILLFAPLCAYFLVLLSLSPLSLLCLCSHSCSRVTLSHPQKDGSPERTVQAICFSTSTLYTSSSSSPSCTRVHMEKK